MQIMVYNEMQVRTKMQLPTYTWGNIDKSQKHHAVQKKPETPSI